MYLMRMVSFHLGLAMVLLSTTASVATASPILQQYHLGQLEQQQPIRTGSTTILDILGERPEFAKLLEVIKKDDGKDPVVFYGHSCSYRQLNA